MSWALRAANQLSAVQSGPFASCIARALPSPRPVPALRMSATKRMKLPHEGK